MTRSRNFLCVSVMLGILAAAVVAPSAQAGKSTDVLYDFSIRSAAGDAIVSDGAGYREPVDAFGAYWNLSPVGTREFRLNLKDAAGEPLKDHLGNPASDYPCVAGSYMYTDTNPFIACYADNEQTRGFVLDYPPYGNATKQTMKLACGVVSRVGTTYAAEVPAEGCQAKVSVVGSGRDAQTWQINAPFRFESVPQS